MRIFFSVCEVDSRIVIPCADRHCDWRRNEKEHVDLAAQQHCGRLWKLLADLLIQTQHQQSRASDRSVIEFKLPPLLLRSA